MTLRILSLDLNTATPTGKLMLTVLGGIAAFERDLMLERQRKASPRPRLKASTRVVPRPHDARPLTLCASRRRASQGTPSLPSLASAELACFAS